MKLYTFRGSRYGSRVQIQIAAKGLQVTTEVVSYPPPESFRAINPLMLVPVLQAEGGLLPESQVICEYLEDRFPTPSLLPDSPAERARMRLLIRLFELYYDPWHLKLFPLPGLPADQRAAQAEAVFAGLARPLALIADHIDPGPYAVGARLSLADCALAPPLLQASVITGILGLPNPVMENPKTGAWFSAVRRDPHVAAVLDDMEPYLRGVLSGERER